MATKTETFSKNYFSEKLGFGYKIKERLALKFGVIRPASWFKYDNVNNIGYERSVWINAWYLSLKKSINLNKKLSFFAEVGGANITRSVFSIEDKLIYEDAHFGSFLYGFGFNYKLNERWRLALNGTFFSEIKETQPTFYFTNFFWFYLLRKEGFDMYTNYSVICPTF